VYERARGASRAGTRVLSRQLLPRYML
jgi:hypothetical protein